MNERHEEIRDVLPDDLNAVDGRVEYRFPDNSRRRIPAVLYAVVAAWCLVVRFATADGSALVNDGLVLAAALLLAAAAVSFTSGWRMTVDESRALVLAAGSVGFVTGHASAQQVWRGLRSRPTWRIFCYSDEEPPLTRALVLVDAVDGRVVECLVEQNPVTTTHSPDGRDG
ncbi:MAG: hypothetical protein RL330_1002 [Actinomycetota bacterium]|jgi:hypothetical protein